MPLLLRRGLVLREREAGNYEVVKYPGLIVKRSEEAYSSLVIVKDSYWRWSERNLSGNAIDFFV